jgi:hypothetical protein
MGANQTSKDGQPVKEESWPRLGLGTETVQGYPSILRRGERNAAGYARRGEMVKDRKSRLPSAAKATYRLIGRGTIESLEWRSEPRAHAPVPAGHGDLFPHMVFKARR